MAFSTSVPTLRRTRPPPAAEGTRGLACGAASGQHSGASTASSSKPSAWVVASSRSFSAAGRGWATTRTSLSGCFLGRRPFLAPCNPNPIEDPVLCPSRWMRVLDVRATSSDPVPLPTRVSQFLSAFYKFTRPHTIRGTILAVIAGTGRALWENRSRIDLRLFPKAIIGMICLLCGNAYIVGINQIFDVDIDKVNKPFLPMASGEIGSRMGWFLVLASGSIGLLLTYLNFPGLIFKLFSLGALLGTLYSVPPFRWRQNPVYAALSIATVRGFLLNFGVYYATTEALGVPFAWNPAVVFLTFFMSLFALVIAITKDLPDIEGDRMFNVATFATKVGPKAMVNMSAAILMINYTAAILLPLVFRSAFKRWWLMIGVHAAIAGILLKRIQSVEENKASLVQYYQFIWKLFYTEFILYPFL